MQQCATASEDGTCIIWDLERFTRNQMVMANSLFQCLVWNLEENQIVTSGTDRKICYWEALDGSLIRQMDGSMSGSVNGMVRSEDGAKFFRGGDDKLVKVWDYDGGVVTSVGSGHSDQILKLALSPDNQSLVSVSRDGAIAIWKI
jgi:WD40 repeat protein